MRARSGRTVDIICRTGQRCRWGRGRKKKSQTFLFYAVDAVGVARRAHFDLGVVRTFFAFCAQNAPAAPQNAPAAPQNVQSTRENACFCYCFLENDVFEFVLQKNQKSRPKTRRKRRFARYVWVGVFFSALGFGYARACGVVSQQTQSNKIDSTFCQLDLVKRHYYHHYHYHYHYQD